VRAPAGVTFIDDPDCAKKYPADLNIPAVTRTYDAQHCIWTDADCDLCTPEHSGSEAVIHWRAPGDAPPQPSFRLVPGDHRIAIAWDNLPETQLAGRIYGSPGAVFWGYRIYKIADWRGRVSEIPAEANWSLLEEFVLNPADTAHGEHPIALVTKNVSSNETRYEQPYFPIGRYVFEDRDVNDGFSYAYAVTSVFNDVVVQQDGTTGYKMAETSLILSEQSVVVPHSEASPIAGKVWVVPNPYRGSAGWDRPPILHDALTSHIDFMGLPRAPCTIKIWTLAGDLVAVLNHDGSNGDGQAPWNLVSRSGQDVSSGVYLFTVDSRLGQQTGRFVVMR
jgi:hypothetical protein